LELFGLKFSYDIQSKLFTLTSSEFSTASLNNLTQGVFDVMHSVNRKGYITTDALSSRFMLIISRYLGTKGYS
jgi:hypothetical protein